MSSAEEEREKEDNVPPSKKKKKSEKKRKKKKKHKKKSGRHSDSGSDSDTIYPSDLKKEHEADRYMHIYSTHAYTRKFIHNSIVVLCIYDSSSSSVCGICVCIHAGHRLLH